MRVESEDEAGEQRAVGNDGEARLRGSERGFGRSADENMLLRVTMR